MVTLQHNLFLVSHDVRSLSYIVHVSRCQNVRGCWVPHRWVGGNFCIDLGFHPFELVFFFPSCFWGLVRPTAIYLTWYQSHALLNHYIPLLGVLSSTSAHFGRWGLFCMVFGNIPIHELTLGVALGPRSI